jgi:hypothetical protein
MALIQLNNTASGGRSGPTPQGHEIIANAWDLIEELPSGAQLKDDLLVNVALAFHGAPPGQVWPGGKLTYGLVKFLGSTSPVHFFFAGDVYQTHLVV